MTPFEHAWQPLAEADEAAKLEVTQRILDALAIGQAPFTGNVGLGLPKADFGEAQTFAVKTDFTERMRAFAPQLFQGRRA